MRFVELLSDKPERRASGAFPRAAKANRPLFYADAARKRKALTVAEVHGRWDPARLPVPVLARASARATVTTLSPAPVPDETSAAHNPTQVGYVPAAPLRSHNLRLLSARPEVALRGYRLRQGEAAKDNDSTRREDRGSHHDRP